MRGSRAALNADYLSLCAIWDRLGVGHRSSGSGSCGEDLGSLGEPDGRTVLEVTDRGVVTGSARPHGCGCSAVLPVAAAGPVIPPADIDRRFQPFQRFGPRSARRDGGHGLGLAIDVAFPPPDPVSPSRATVRPGAGPVALGVSRQPTLTSTPSAQDRGGSRAGLS
jgi:hypothetical protein